MSRHVSRSHGSPLYPVICRRVIAHPVPFRVVRVVVLKNGSLYIKELRYDDEARYGCIAGNSGGFSRQETQLFVRGERRRHTEQLQLLVACELADCVIFSVLGRCLFNSKRDTSFLLRYYDE